MDNGETDPARPIPVNDDGTDPVPVDDHETDPTRSPPEDPKTDPIRLIPATNHETDPIEPPPADIRETDHARPLVSLESTVGRYKLCYELARGGMATVYLARMIADEGFGKVVAIKCIHPHLAAQPEFVEMFLDEARLASRISHPNVCSIIDFGEEQGTYFLALEFLLASPWADSSADSLRRLATPPKTAFDWLCT